MPLEPAEAHRRLLQNLGESDPLVWQQRWRQRLAGCVVPELIDASLLWGLALPLLSWLELRRATTPQGPRGCPVVALNGPVGSGKSSLAKVLQALAPAIGCRLAVASIDDAYLDWDARCAAMAGNPFGVNRVPPGSHDPDLLVEAIDAWRLGAALRLPRFDKTLRGGDGDRAGWSSGPADALLLEGWMVGCSPVGDEALSTWISQQRSLGAFSSEELNWLPHWNQNLRAYGPLWDRCTSLWLLQPTRSELVRRWRFQAEAKQRRHQIGLLAINKKGSALVSQQVHAASSQQGDGEACRSQTWLSPRALDGLVRATQASLPAQLYQHGLVERAIGVACLDAQRRCRWAGPGGDQSSVSSSLMG